MGHVITTQAGRIAVVHAPSFLNGELKSNLEAKGFFVRTSNEVLFSPLKDELFDTHHRLVHSTYADLLKRGKYARFYQSAISHASGMHNESLKRSLKKQHKHYKEIMEHKNRHRFISQSLGNYTAEGKRPELFAVFLEGGKGYEIKLRHRGLPSGADTGKLEEAFSERDLSFPLTLRVISSNGMPIMQSGIPTLAFSGSRKALGTGLHAIVEGIAAVFHMNGSGNGNGTYDGTHTGQSHRHREHGHQ